MDKITPLVKVELLREVRGYFVHLSQIVLAITVVALTIATPH